MRKTYLLILLVIVIRGEQKDDYCIFLNKNGKDVEKYKDDGKSVDLWDKKLDIVSMGG